MTKEKKITTEELAYRQSLPLEIKEKLSFDRVRSFAKRYGTDGIYVGYSGGIDSNVVLDIARKYDSHIIGVYLDTWLEFPEIRESICNHDNIITIKPEKTLREIIKDNGWCYPSKDIAAAISAYRKGKSWAIKKLNGLDKDNMPSDYRQQYKKWLKLADTDIPISDGCCIDMKEKPAAEFEKRTGMKPILGLRAEESARRREGYLRTGCITFDSNRPTCKPIAFYTKQDILRYHLKHKLTVPSPYGDIIEKGQVPGQLSLFDLGCSSCPSSTLATSGEPRTGCLFCPVACHLDKLEKFKRLQLKYPKIYDFCMEELNQKQLLEWIKNNVM